MNINLLVDALCVWAGGTLAQNAVCCRDQTPFPKKVREVVGRWPTGFL